GRMLTRDTWQYDYQNPVELNRYVYVANNPVMFTDPSGYSMVTQGQLQKKNAPFIRLQQAVRAAETQAAASLHRAAELARKANALEAARLTASNAQEVSTIMAKLSAIWAELHSL